MTEKTDADNVLLLASVRGGVERLVAQGVLTARFTCPSSAELPSPDLKLPLATVEPDQHAGRPQ
jgi:hypothetical protein